MKDPCISFGYLLEPCLFFRILFQFLAFKKVIEFRKKVVVFLQRCKLSHQQKKGVHLSICAFVRGLKNIQKKAT
jgi:hypothetical protein